MSAPIRLRLQQCGLLIPRFDLPSSTWWRWVRSGVAPKPVKLGLGVTAWNVGDLREFLARKEAA